MRRSALRARHFALNTTSTADISFVLLIFFLLTTSMDHEAGLSRRLPPATPQKSAPAEVLRERSLEVSITASGGVFIAGHATEPEDVEGVLTEWIGQPTKEDRYIILTTDPAARYDTYFHLQAALRRGRLRGRSAIARQLYGREYGRLREADRAQVDSLSGFRMIENSTPHAPHS